MNGLDLFSGIGLLSLAVSPWVRTVAYCEREPYACGVLMSRMADNQLHRAPIWDDVRSLRAEHLKGLGQIDIITGGFPCQDLSVAGSRKGLDGERSGLYREVIRLVRDVRPRFLLLENVPGIRKQGHVVVGDLAGLGYDSRWLVTEAAQVGAPHKRSRWWCLAANTDSSVLWEFSKRQQFDAAERGNSIAGDARCERGSGEDCGRGGGMDSEATVTNADGGGQPKHSERHDHDGQSPCGRNTHGCDEAIYWQEVRPPFPALRGMDDGSAYRVDQLAALGNSVVWQQARRAFMTLAGIL